MSTLTPLPAQSPIGTVTLNGKPVNVALNPLWSAWLQRVQSLVQTVGNSGGTAARPLDTAQVPLFVGQDFFDTDLGFKVTVASLQPTVWVNGAGVPS